MFSRPKPYIILLLLLVIGVGLLHNFTPVDRILLHDFYRRISYLPIVIAAILYGIKGGVFLAACTSIAYIPHLRHFYHLGVSAYLKELPEVLLYFGAGIVTGSIAAREQRLRIKYQNLVLQLKQSYKKLHTQTTTLVEVEEQLHTSQKLSALGQLSASLAHEVKNPLAGIRGAAEILADDFPEGHPKHEFAEILLKETSRLSTTVEEVLHYSKRQLPDQRSPRVEPLPIVLERVATLLDSSFRSKNISLRLKLSNHADKILLDVDKMSQVFINLFLNSYEFLEENGCITIQDRENESKVEILFQDDGPGVPTSEQNKIFAPFYSTREEGTGLGLTISSRIVESYGGTLRLATPENGTGALFIITLPKIDSGT